MTTVADIATALSTVTGIKGVPNWPNTPTAGMAWPRIASRDLDPFPLINWEIYVALSADQKAATDKYTSVVPLIRDALRAHVFVTKDEPVVIPGPQNSMFAVLITARSE